MKGNMESLNSPWEMFLEDAKFWVRRTEPPNCKILFWRRSTTVIWLDPPRHEVVEEARLSEAGKEAILANYSLDI